jgi:hypothetical protein
LASVAHEASLPRSSPDDDPRTTVAGQVDEEARVIDTPALSVVAEISDDHLECWEGTVAVVGATQTPASPRPTMRPAGLAGLDVRSSGGRNNDQISID